MKITFLMGSGFTLSGGDRVIEIHARKMQQRGHDVEVVSRPAAKAPLRRQVKSLLRGRGLIPDPSTHRSHFTDSPVPHRCIDRYRPIVASDLPDADVVVATWWETAPWAAALPLEKGAKAYFVQHYEAFDNMPKDRVDATWGLDLHKITISQWLVDLARDFGDEDVTLVPNSVDMAQFHAPPRAKQAIPSIGFLNHTATWKGVPVSVAAVAGVLDRLPAVRLHTFGETEFTAELPDRVYHEHWQNPPQDLLREIYAKCDVWLCGSTSEGFHLPPLEAMACRCPVVSTMVGGPLDIIRNGYNGYLAPVGDVGALAVHLLSVLGAPDEDWRRMSDGAYATAIGYSWDDAAQLFEAGLRRAIGRSRQ